MIVTDTTTPPTFTTAITYSGTGAPTHIVDYKPAMVMIKSKDPEAWVSYDTTTGVLTSSNNDVEKLNKAVKCLIEVLSPKQKKQFFTLWKGE